MRHKSKFILIPLAAIAFIALIGFVVMQLWNNLMPAIFHTGTITYYQALGLFILCKILFGFHKPGGKFGGGAPWMRGRMEERFKNMSPEEREKFKEKWSDKCGWGRHRGEGRGPFDRGRFDTEKETPAKEA